jgi:hypothetical protein
MGTQASRGTTKPLRFPLPYMGGDYTALVSVGSQGKAANVILDTDSSTLALDGNVYDPSACGARWVPAA